MTNVYIAHKHWHNKERKHEICKTNKALRDTLVNFDRYRVSREPPKWQHVHDHNETEARWKIITLNVFCKQPPPPYLHTLTSSYSPSDAPLSPSVTSVILPLATMMLAGDTRPSSRTTRRPLINFMALGGNYRKRSRRETIARPT